MKWKMSLAILSLGAVLVGVGPVTTYADKLSQAESQMDSLMNQQSSTQTTVSELKKQEGTLQSQIQALQAQVEALQKSIMNKQTDVEHRQADIAKLKDEIVQTEKDIQEQNAVLAQRIRVMYEAGQGTYLDVLFSATSFSDLLDRLELLSRIAQQDHAVLQNIQDSKQKLDSEQKDMEAQLAQVQQALQQLEQQKSQQENAQNTEMKLLGQVHDKRLTEESQLRSENAAMSNLRDLISQLEAEQGVYSGPAGGWTWPVPGHHTISSGYGWRTWSDGSREFHNGIDIPAAIGTPIVAATSGRVLMAGPASGFGDWVVIQSSGGLLEIYGHMYAYEIKVRPGEIVTTGQVIAGVGNNGFSTGAHLHFTVATGFDSSGFAISTNPLKYVG